MKRTIALACAAVLLPLVLSAQEILTADAFFKELSARYSAIVDYEADVVVTTGKQTMTGTVIYKSPTFMRMDFSEPAQQVIVYDGQNLVVYIPEFRAVLSQQTGSSSAAAGATGEGLRMLGRNYSAAFETGPTPVLLPGSTNEMVIRLIMSRLTVAEGFRTITLSVDPGRMLIRRMDGITLVGDKITYDFTDMQLDQGLPDTRFIYDSPASANVYNNFLFSSDS